VAVIAAGERIRVRVVTTVVAFKRLSPEEVDCYLSCGEWRGKAGGYAIQGRAAAFIRQIIGSHSNVVGLPLFETCALLQGLGHRCPAWSEAAADDAHR
jgi:septum formation protein